MVTKTKDQDRISKKLGRVIELPGDLVVVSRKKFTRVLEDLDDLAVAAERRKETPVPWEEAKKKLKGSCHNMVDSMRRSRYYDCIREAPNSVRQALWSGVQEVALTL